MKTFKTRLGQNLIYSLLYFFSWKILGFELTVIVILSQIIAEIHFKIEN